MAVSVRRPQARPLGQAVWGTGGLAQHRAFIFRQVQQTLQPLTLLSVQSSIGTAKVNECIAVSQKHAIPGQKTGLNVVLLTNQK